MSTPHLRTTVTLLLTLLAAVPLLGQGKDMPQAGQYYKQKPPRFKMIQGPKKGGEVKFKGDRVEMEKDEYAILEGRVVVEYQDVKIQADKLTLNQKTKDVVAEGHVIVDEGPSRVTADHAVYNLDSKAGTFFNATGFMDPSMYFTGEKIEKVDEDTYRLTNGLFTSCDLDRPAWSFHVRSAEVTIDDYAHLRDLTFRARNIPVFWAPRLIWPTKKDRARGFLIPRVLLSSGKSQFGERIELGYFIPFGDSVDTTLYADLNTKGYNGAGIDIRYLPSPNVTLGELSAYAVRNQLANRVEWKYNYRHAQDNLPGGFRGVVDVQDFSDLDFFRQYDRDPRLHTLSNIYSSAYLTRNRANYSLNFLADRRDIVLGHVSSDPTSEILKQRFQQLPSLQFRVYPERIGQTPFYFSLESSVSHLVTSGLVNGPEADYGRGDIFPTMSMQIRTPPWLSIRPQVSVRDTYYSATLDPSSLSSTGQQQTLDQSLNRVYGQGQVEVVGPSFSKVFNKPLGGFTKFKHIIEPRFRYVYTTNVNDQERVIRFDTVDSPFLPIVRDSIEYSLTQRLIGKEAGPNSSPREVLSFSLRQTASLSKPFTTSTGGTTFTPATNQKFTPLLASLHVNPYQSITLDASTTFGNVSHQVDQTSLSANLIGTGKNSDKYLSFTWFASFSSPIPGSPGQHTTGSSQIRLNTGSSLLRDRIRADIQVNFDAKKGTFLEQRYLLGGNGSCYGVALEFRRYLVFVPTQKFLSNIGIAITLKNVGTIGTH